MERKAGQIIAEGLTEQRVDLTYLNWSLSRQSSGTEGMMWKK